MMAVAAVASSAPSSIVVLSGPAGVVAAAVASSNAPSKSCSNSIDRFRTWSTSARLPRFDMLLKVDLIFFLMVLKRDDVLLDVVEVAEAEEAALKAGETGALLAADRLSISL